MGSLQAIRGACELLPPLSWMPESFSACRVCGVQISPSASRAEPTTFQRCPTRSVRWPERFRGGCSFGAPTLAASVALPAGCNWHDERYLAWHAVAVMGVIH